MEFRIWENYGSNKFRKIVLSFFFFLGELARNRSMKVNRFFFLESCDIRGIRTEHSSIFFGSEIKRLSSSPSNLKIRLIRLSNVRVYYISEKYTYTKKGDEFELKFVESQAQLLFNLSNLRYRRITPRRARSSTKSWFDSTGVSS